MNFIEASPADPFLAIILSWTYCISLKWDETKNGNGLEQIERKTIDSIQSSLIHTPDFFRNYIFKMTVLSEIILNTHTF